MLRGVQTLSFEVAALSSATRCEQLADVPDPTQSHVEPLDILGLDLDATLAW